MKRFEIQQVLDSALPEVASFLHTQDASRSDDPRVPTPVGQDIVSIERRLRWLLLDNPFATPGSPHGFCIRDDSGVMRGLLLSFPSGFVAGDRRLMGLGSGGFFVDAPARTMGFYLFKKYLRSQGYSIFFSTTCSPNSAALWTAVGGCPIPNSELEYILPLRLDTLLPALVGLKTSNRLALATADLFGRCGNRMMQFSRQRSAGITIEPCQDWQKLSQLFHRYRSNDCITADRSPGFLEWRYGQNSNPCPSAVYLFRDRCGSEGWFSLGSIRRGHWGQLTGCVLLDVICPREKMSITDILPEIVHLVAGKFDVLSLRPRSGVEYRAYSRWVIQHRFAAANGFVVTRNGNSLFTAAALDLSWADGDSMIWSATVCRPAEDGSSQLRRKESGPIDDDQRRFVWHGA